MTYFLKSIKQIRLWQWLLAALVLIYIIYIALSYLYLPNKLKQVVETDVAELIGRNIAVERFEFNPFVLSLKVVGFSIADKPEKPLVALDNLFADFSFWRSLFSWQIVVEELALDRPKINIEKYQNRFNFSEIIEKFNSKDAPEASSEDQPVKSSRMALEICYTAVNHGTFEFTDLSGDKPARSSMDDVSIKLEFLYFATGDKHLNPFDIEAKLPGGGDLRLSGQYRIDPLHIDAEASVKNMQLATFSEFVENIIPIKVSNGFLSVSTRVLAKQEARFQLQVAKGHFSITDLALDDDVPDPPMLRAGVDYRRWLGAGFFAEKCCCGKRDFGSY